VKIAIHFGALTPRIEEQLESQGLKLDMLPSQRQFLQKRVDDVCDLRIAGILTDRESTNARKRLLKIITKHAKPL
jgi:hypothetical protein